MLWPPGESSQEPIPRFTNPVQLTAAVGVEDYPAWPSDGGRLAYQSNQAVGTDGVYVYFTWQENQGDIWVMDVVTDESE